MTLRMSELFEEHVKPIMSQFKSGKKRSAKGGNATKRTSARPKRNNGAGPSTSHHHNSDDSDDDDHNDGRNGRTNGRSQRTHAQSNGVSSSSSMLETQPSSAKRSRPQKTTDEDSDESNTSSDESSDNSDESSGIPLSELGRMANKPVRKPHKKRMKPKKRGAVSSSSPKKMSRNAKRRKVENSDDGEPEPEPAENTEVETHSESQRSSPEPQTSSRRSRRTATNRRIQSSSDDDNLRNSGNNDKLKRVSRRPKRYESDQSFHVEGSNKRTADSDSDKPRATRESAKKKFLEWALTSGDDDDDDEDFDQKPQTSSQAQKAATKRSVSKKVLRSESDQSDGKKSKTLVPSRRSTRTQRASQSQSQGDESESEENQDMPSTSTNVRSNNRVTNGQPPAQASLSSRTTRSSQNQPATRSTSNDHNYGEPGPSSSVSIAPRQTRSAILSRHQRNADELDRSGLEDSSMATATQNNRLLRLRSANLRAAPTATNNFELLNGIRRTTRTRVMHNYFEDENENDAEDSTANRLQPTLQNTSRLRTARPEQPAPPEDEESDSYSEEDKTPLKQVASNSKKVHEHNTRNGTAVNNVKRNLYSDGEQVRYSVYDCQM